MTSEPHDPLRPILEAINDIAAVYEVTGRPPTLVSREVAAASLDISLNTFARYVQPHIPHVVIGKRVLYRPADLERWASRQVQDPAKRKGPGRSSD